MGRTPSKHLNLNRSKLTESRLDLMTFDFNTMLNYSLSKKLKVIEICNFNYLINTLTYIRIKYEQIYHCICKIQINKIITKYSKIAFTFILHNIFSNKSKNTL
jgi:hypothetical protein